MNYSFLLSLLGASLISARRAPSCSDNKSSSIKCHSSSSKSSKCSQSSSLHDNTKCSRQLQSIVHVPSDIELFEDSSKLETQFRALGQVLFTPQNASYVWSFEQKYGVQVYISDGFGNSWDYDLNPPTVQYFQSQDMSRSWAHSQLNFPGFSYDPNTQAYYYTFNIYSLEGEQIIVTLTNAERQLGK